MWQACESLIRVQPFAESSSEMNGLLSYKPHEKKQKKLVVFKFDTDLGGDGYKRR